MSTNVPKVKNSTLLAIQVENGNMLDALAQQFGLIHDIPNNTLDVGGARGGEVADLSYIRAMIGYKQHPALTNQISNMFSTYDNVFNIPFSVTSYVQQAAPSILLRDQTTNDYTHHNLTIIDGIIDALHNRYVNGAIPPYNALNDINIGQATVNRQFIMIRQDTPQSIPHVQRIMFQTISFHAIVESAEDEYMFGRYRRDVALNYPLLGIYDIEVPFPKAHLNLFKHVVFNLKVHREQFNRLITPNIPFWDTVKIIGDSDVHSDLVTFFLPLYISGFITEIGIHENNPTNEYSLRIKLNDLPIPFLYFNNGDYGIKYYHQLFYDENQPSQQQYDLIDAIATHTINTVISNIYKAFPHYFYFNLGNHDVFLPFTMPRIIQTVFRIPVYNADNTRSENFEIVTCHMPRNSTDLQTSTTQEHFQEINDISITTYNTTIGGQMSYTAGNAENFALTFHGDKYDTKEKFIDGAAEFLMLNYIKILCLYDYDPNNQYRLLILGHEVSYNGIMEVFHDVDANTIQYIKNNKANLLTHKYKHSDNLNFRDIFYDDQFIVERNPNLRIMLQSPVLIGLMDRAKAYVRNIIQTLNDGAASDFAQIVRNHIPTLRIYLMLITQEFTYLQFIQIFLDVLQTDIISTS